MTLPRILHLVDDTNAGGVMRCIDHLQRSPRLAALGQHRIVEVSRGAGFARRFDAEVIVSHRAVSWRHLPWFISLRAMHANVPLVHVEHTYTRAFSALNVPGKARFRALLATTYSLFDKVVGVSRAQADWLAEREMVAPGNLHVIPSAVDVAPFLALPPGAPRPRVIGAIGRLDRQKGFDTLIAATLECRADLRLDIFGDGPERAALARLAGDSPRIRLLGWSDPVQAMASVDAVAMPSRWEAYGIVGLEARAACRPLLVSGADGLQDHAAAGAIVVEGGSIAAWASALERLSRGVPADRIEAARHEAANASHRFADGWEQLFSALARPRDAAQAA